MTAKKYKKSMKKTLTLSVLLASSLIFGSSTTFADTVIQEGEIPQAIHKFLSENFAKEKISVAKKDGGILFISSPSYDVILTNGTKIEFDSKGNWKEISIKSEPIPQALIPTKIANAVASKFPNAKIISIEKDRKNFEVKLSNNYELELSEDGKILDIDD